MPVIFLTSGTTSFPDPGDWNTAQNTVECIGVGGVTNTGSGGGGAYAVATNINPVFPVTVGFQTPAGNMNEAVQFGGNGTATPSSTYCSARSALGGTGGGPSGFPSGFAGGSGAGSSGGGAAGPNGAGGPGDQYGNVGGSANGGLTPGGASGQPGVSSNLWGGGYGPGSGGGPGGNGALYGGGRGNNSALFQTPGLIRISYELAFVPPPPAAAAGIARGETVIRTGSPTVIVGGAMVGGIAAKGRVVYRSVSAAPSWNLFNNIPAYQIWDGTYTLGFRFRSSVPGAITHHRMYVMSGIVPTVFRIFTPAGSLLSSIVPSVSATGWQQFALPSPLTIAANTSYWATWYSAVSETYAQADMNFPVVAGPLTADLDGYSTTGGDVWSEAELRTASGGWWFNDIVFRPS